MDGLKHLERRLARFADNFVSDLDVEAELEALLAEESPAKKKIKTTNQLEDEDELALLELELELAAQQQMGGGSNLNTLLKRWAASKLMCDKKTSQSEQRWCQLTFEVPAIRVVISRYTQLSIVSKKRGIEIADTYKNQVSALRRRLESLLKTKKFAL